MRFDGGRPCLDLVATQGPHASYEQLGTSEQLRAWLTGAGLLRGEARLAVEPDWLEPFLVLRGTLAALVGAALEGGPAGAAHVAALNAAARAAPLPAPQAVRLDDGTLAPALAAPPSREALLGAVARDGVDLLTDPLACARLRCCEGEGCSTVYLDTSRGRRRRWCSSAVCGNRERVARHRRRTIADTVRD